MTMNVVLLEQHYKTPLRQKPSFFTKANTDAPKALVQKQKPAEWTWEYQHCIYVNFFGKHYKSLHYTLQETKTLREFVLQQDRLQDIKGGRNGYFRKPLARIGKVYPASAAYAAGQRWQFCMGRGKSFQLQTFATLNDMLTALSKALA